MSKSKFNEYGKPIVVLTLICLVVTAALAFTYDFTKPIIDAINERIANETRASVLPEGTSFTQSDAALADGVIEVYVADNGAGMVVTSAAKGFGGDITVMTGIDANGKITGVSVTSHGETPGLGTKAMTETYLANYQGLDEAVLGTTIDGVTGATYSS
ncbi:MAG: FMN-binding protein, partial [Firmicutes bacterium]|nr:FMN-binding protein [Bacillota bacterium]